MYIAYIKIRELIGTYKRWYDFYDGYQGGREEEWRNSICIQEKTPASSGVLYVYLETVLAFITTTQ